jgi:tetrahydromethanopterin S-methyltransferase subunit G
MKNKDNIHQRLDEICEKGEEITGKISQLNNKDLEKKLKIMEELEINLNELVDYIREWNETQKAKNT